MYLPVSDINSPECRPVIVTLSNSDQLFVYYFEKDSHITYALWLFYNKLHKVITNYPVIVIKNNTNEALTVLLDDTYTRLDDAEDALAEDKTKRKPTEEFEDAEYNIRRIKFFIQIITYHMYENIRKREATSNNDMKFFEDDYVEYDDEEYYEEDDKEYEEILQTSSCHQNPTTCSHNDTHDIQQQIERIMNNPAELRQVIDSFVLQTADIRNGLVKNLQ
ncbi:unnamed protein product [Rotaria sordida]|uniref:Uncharacterized protein n=1 Tax=Rotaria sordida TaxID=392033 RepID=A0A819EYE8_9BILA|nr:unnamed protein product [Rotaria sordida]